MAKEKKTKTPRKKKVKSGLGLRVAAAAVYYGIPWLAVFLMVLSGSSGSITGFLPGGLMLYIFGTLQLILACLGNRSKGANIVCIVLSGMLWMCGGIFGIIGGIQGLKYVKEQKEQGAAQSVEKPTETRAKTPTEAPVEIIAESSAENVESAPQSAPTGLLADILSERVCELIVHCRDSQTGEVSTAHANKIGWYYSEVSGKRELYVGLRQEGNAGVFIARYVPEEERVYLEKDEVAEKVYEEWSKEVVEAEKQAKSGKPVMPKLDLYDSIITTRDWKAFKKTATQEELVVLAIGAKYRTSGKQFFTKALISVLGSIASVVIGILSISELDVFFSLAILIGGYGFFSLMASKLAAYSTTYKKCLRLLDKENKDYVEGLFPKGSTFERVMHALVEIGLNFFIFPFQLIMMIISMFIPKAAEWAVAHGAMSDAIVVSIPKGYDIGGLGAIGEYYASQSFSAIWDEHLEEEERRKAEEKRRVVTEGGYARTLNYTGYTVQNGEYVDEYTDDLGNRWVRNEKIGEADTYSREEGDGMEYTPHNR